MLSHRVDNLKARNHAFANGVINHRGGVTCFHCSHAIWTDVAIYWHGEDERGEDRYLYFHHGCAVEFTIRLMRDVHEIECQYNLAIHVKPTRNPHAQGDGAFQETR